MSKDCFIDALNDHNLEWAVLQGKPHSVEDALKLALEYEAFQKGRRGRYGDVRPFSTQGQDLTSDINGGGNLRPRVTKIGDQMAMANVNNVPFVNALAMLKKPVTRRETFKMLVTEPVTSVIPKNTLSGTVKQGAATYRITQAIKGDNLPVNDSLFLTGNAYGVDIKFLVDTGATLSVLHPDKYYTIPKKHRPPLESYKLKLRMGDRALRSTLGCSVIPLVFNGQLLPLKDGHCRYRCLWCTRL